MTDDNIIFIQPKVLQEAEIIALEIVKGYENATYSAIAIALTSAFKILIKHCESQCDQDSPVPYNQAILFHSFYKDVLKELGIDYECLDKASFEAGD